MRRSSSKRSVVSGSSSRKGSPSASLRNFKDISDTSLSRRKFQEKKSSSKKGKRDHRKLSQSPAPLTASGHKQRINSEKFEVSNFKLAPADQSKSHQMRNVSEKIEQYDKLIEKLSNHNRPLENAQPLRKKAQKEVVNSAANNKAALEEETDKALIEEYK